MPEDTEFKQVVRARMGLTGEKYNTAKRAVLAAARAAVPRWQDDPLVRLPVLAGSDLAGLITEHLPAAAGRTDGDRVTAVLSDLCRYLASWRKDLADEKPLELWNVSAGENLAACAAELAEIPVSDPRLLAISASWDSEVAAPLMLRLDETLLASIGFNLSGGDLIDILAGRPPGCCWTTSTGTEGPAGEHGTTPWSWCSSPG
jgi:hypothetical protein